MNANIKEVVENVFVALEWGKNNYLENCDIGCVEVYQKNNDDQLLNVVNSFQDSGGSCTISLFDDRWMEEVIASRENNFWAWQVVGLLNLSNLL